MSHKTIISGATLIAAFMLTSPLAFAHDTGEEHTHTATPTASVSPRAEKKAEKKEELEAARATKLADAKLKACQNREAAMQKRSTQVVTTTENMQAKFAAILNRVKEYYTGKLVPAGKTVANYDALIADITTKQEAVDTALATAQAAAEDFSCTSDDPKGQLTTFRTSMQAVKSAMQKERTSIKNLIVAVKGVAKTSPSPSATPTTTPSPIEE